MKIIPSPRRGFISRTLAAALLTLPTLFISSQVLADNCSDLLRKMLGHEKPPVVEQKLNEQQLKAITSNRICIKSFPWGEAHDAFFEEGRPNWNSEVAGSIRKAILASDQSQEVINVAQKLSRQPAASLENL
ncbi:MAG: hypothetical protein V4819_16525, partial [Verrucomicrobiota bacterium]